MDDAWLVDTGDWRQPSIVVLESREPRQLNHVRTSLTTTRLLIIMLFALLCQHLFVAVLQVLNQYLSFLQRGDGQEHAPAAAFSEKFSGWLEEKALIGYNR
jgi:hypothetical protein